MLVAIGSQIQKIKICECNNKKLCFWECHKGQQAELQKGIKPIYQDNFIEKKESSQHQLKGALGTPWH